MLAGDVGLGPPGEDDQSEPRLSLHTEAGANDGLAAPLVLLGLVVAAGSGLGGWVLADVALRDAGGRRPGVWRPARGSPRSWSGCATASCSPTELDGFVALGMALAIYGATEALDAYGLLAVFAAGVAFRRYEHAHEVNHSMHRGAELAGRLLELIVLMLLGAMLSLDGLRAPGLAGWAAVAALLVVVRPLLVLARPPAASSASASGSSSACSACAASRRCSTWPSPWATGRSVSTTSASVVWTALACVTVSVVAHGMAASPLARRLLRAVAWQRSANSLQVGRRLTSPRGRMRCEISLVSAAYDAELDRVHQIRRGVQPETVLHRRFRRRTRPHGACSFSYP